MIVTSRSAVSAYQTCPRKRFLNYEAENGTSTQGWERRALAIPLATGIYVHQGLEAALRGSDAAAAAHTASSAYRAEVEARGLAVEDGTDEALVIEEQVAHVEAMVMAWCRIRLPKWLDEYEVVEIESEDRVPLSDDVTLAVRADVVVRRRFDHRMFVVNFKTVGNADDRWLRAWEVDMQLMTELLAAERRHGQVFGGVIIEGIVKGQRVGVDERLMEVRGDKEKVKMYIDRSRLLYGYKRDADPPLVPLEYSWESQRQKGWYKFRTWQEQGLAHGEMHSERPDANGVAPRWSSLEYWVNWLPEEALEDLFITVPPIMRSQEMIESKVRQIVGMERRVGFGTQLVNIQDHPDHAALLDEHFPQNEHACTYPSRCAFWDVCWSPGVADDIAGSGLYQPRVDHHKGSNE